ncbi:choline/carnitine/betaine transporter [Salinisphaera sp. PC39]|uniref:BCCT family transporter n=1 Tax=Salinisphaera sp. PC39 TaxID=1304156 RepID=UPI003341203B
MMAESPSSATTADEPVRINRTTTAVSLVLILLFVGIGAVWPDQSAAVFDRIQNWVLLTFRWYFVAIVGFVLAFVLWLGLGRYRNVRLGGDEEAPEFTYLSWFSMLFAAGMGIGLIFWSIAEPLSHYAANPFVAAGQTPAAASAAMRLTFFHWGLSAWGIYALMALGLAYFAFRRGRPLVPRSILHEVFGRHADGPLGQIVDIATVFGAAFGIATSLGLGVQQIEGGLTYLIGAETGLTRELWILAIITLIAMVSAVSGVRRGVRLISDFNLMLSGVILLFFLAFGPTLHVLNLLVETTGAYLQTLPELSTWTDVQEHSGWQENWTLFYWGWWIAWSPFVGMFIARISRGRTLREFVMGVLLVPVLLTFAWLAITGGTALYLEVFEGANLLAPLQSDITQPLYRTVELIAPGGFAPLVSGLLVLLVATFFITSCDSGTLVISTILSNGASEPPLPLRVVWGLTLGALAGVLLLAGGLAALQTAAIVAGLPVGLLLIVVMVALVRGLHSEPQAPRAGEHTRAECEPWTGMPSPNRSAGDGDESGGPRTSGKPR